LLYRALFCQKCANKSLMKRYLLLVLLISAAAKTENAPPLAEEKGALERCQVHLDLGSAGGQQITISGDRVKGPDFNVSREGEVYFGFTREKTTRFKLSDDGLSGTVAGMDLMLHVTFTDRCTAVSGLVGIRRVKAEVCPDAVTVQASGSLQVASSSHLHLSGGLGVLRGQFGQGANISAAKLELSGCKLEDIAARPALIVLVFLWWLGV
jgi:hypothetical protein